VWLPKSQGEKFKVEAKKWLLIPIILWTLKMIGFSLKKEFSGVEIMGLQMLLLMAYSILVIHEITTT